MTQEHQLRGRHTAAAVARSCAAHEAQGGVGHAIAYRQLLQLAADLSEVSDAGRVALAADEPDEVAGRWKDAVAALIEHRFAALRMPLPAWFAACVGHPDDPWEPRRDAQPLWFPVDLTAVPEPFLRRGVLIEASELD